ncbi:unnamed protein product, partial [Scytosiphon promiscuus]
SALCIGTRSASHHCFRQHTSSSQAACVTADLYAGRFCRAEVDRTVTTVQTLAKPVRFVPKYQPLEAGNKPRNESLGTTCGRNSAFMDDERIVPMAWTALVGAGTVLLASRYLLKAILGTNGTMTMGGKHCIVTGGSSGIGKEVAKQLVREGAHVTIVARRQGVLDAAMKEVEACRVQPDQMLQTISVDVGDAAAVEKAMGEAVAKQGTAQVVANCAGFAIAKEFDEMNAVDFERLLRVNTLGSANVTRALLPSMKAAGSGRILFTSSMAGQSGSYGYAAYSASKFALVGLAQSLQMEVKAYGIGISVAYPPDTDTPGFETENVGKPEVTRLIGEEAGGLFSPTKASRGVKAGDFCITFGVEGYLVGLATAGFAPCYSVTQAVLQQVLAAGVLRASAFYYNWRFYGMAATEKRRKDSSSAAQSMSAR